MDELYLNKKQNTVTIFCMRILLIFILLLQYNFFMLKSFGNLSDGASNPMLIITIIGLCLLLVEGIKVYVFKNRLLIFLLGFMITCSIFRSIFLFPSDVSTIVKLYISWFSILIYFPLTLFFDRDKDFFIKTITIFNMIFVIILLIQYFYFSQWTKIFLDEKYFVDNLTKLVKIDTRDGNLRITKSWTMCIASFLISFSLLLKKTQFNKKINLLNVCLTIIYIILVVQTRVLILALFVTYLSHLFIKFKNRLTLKDIALLIGTLIAIFIIGFCSNMKENILNFISSFSDERYKISNYARQEALSYYMDIFFKNPLFGNGVFIGLPGSEAYALSRGPMGIFYYDDLGMIGNMAQFGVISIIVLVYYIKNNFMIFNKKYAYLSIFVVYYTVTMVTTLSWIHKEAIISFIFSLSFFDSELKNYKEYLRKEII